MDLQPLMGLWLFGAALVIEYDREYQAGLMHLARQIHMTSGFLWVASEQSLHTHRDLGPPVLRCQSSWGYAQKGRGEQTEGCAPKGPSQALGTTGSVLTGQI